MPRLSLVVRAARRAAMAFSVFPPTRNSNGGRYPSPSHTCPYCSKTLQSRPAKDRHIITKLYCHLRHLYALSNPVAKRRKRKRKRQNASDTSTDEPPPKHPRTHGGPSLPSGTDPAQPHLGGSPESSGQRPPETDDERTCGQPFVEAFPVSTAGAPISDEVKPRLDLCEYLKSCGKLSDPELFSVAELLTMTVPKSKHRTLHLKSPAVSRCASI